jgi:PAS domain S-box-containing protein
MDSALHRSEVRMRLMVEQSKELKLYYELEPKARFEYVSPAAGEIFGLPPAAIEANPDLAMALVDEGDRGEMIRALSSGAEGPITAKIRRPDGEERWVECHFFALRDDDGQAVGVIGSIRDVTQRFAAQNELLVTQRYTRALLENLPDTVFRLNQDGIVLDFVPGEAMAGVQPSVMVIQRELREALPANFAKIAEGLMHSALRSGKEQHSVIDSSFDGETRCYEIRCVPFQEDECLLILRDITAGKWHEEEKKHRPFRDELDAKIERRRDADPYGLTYRELAILHLVAEGASDRQIADSLGISTYTVNKHVGNILGKMNASSRTEAGVRAIRERLVG